MWFCWGWRPWPLPLKSALKVPLAEVARGVALLLQQLGEIDFLLPEVTRVGAGNSVAEGIASGEATSPRRGTDRCAGVVTGESHAGLGHSVEVGRLDVRVAVEAGISPAEVIRHAEDDVWALRSGRMRQEAGARKQEDEEDQASHERKLFRGRG